MIKNNRGQALIESVSTLPTLFLIFAVLLMILHKQFSFYIVDHWVYQAAICLEADVSKQVCKNNLKNKVSRIPFLRVGSIGLHRNSLRIHVKAELNYSYWRTYRTENIETKFTRPLKIRDFSRSL